MKQYIRVYGKLVSMNVSSLLAFRSAFIANLISSTAWASFTFFSIFLLTANVPVLFGWVRDQVIFLSAIYAVYYGLFQVLFAKNFGQLAVLIDNGELDGFFLKPIDAQFLTSLSRIGVTASIRIPMGIGFMYFFGRQLGVTLSLQHGIFFVVSLCCSLLLLYSVWMNILLCLIWNPRLSNLVEVLFTVSGMSRYPSEMYKATSEVLMYALLPLTLTTVVPVKLLFGTVSWQEYVLLVGLTLVFFITTRIFWLFATRFYTSASN